MCCVLNFTQFTFTHSHSSKTVRFLTAISTLLSGTKFLVSDHLQVNWWSLRVVILWSRYFKQTSRALFKHIASRDDLEDKLKRNLRLPQVTVVRPTQIQWLAE